MSSEKKALHTFGAVTVYGTADDDQIFFYKSVMKVDADGAPNAIGPHDTGLDRTSSAGHPGHWTSIVTSNGKPSGTPVLQGAGNPFPKMFISTTALGDARFGERDVRRYVNASIIPYVSVLGATWKWANHVRGLQKGDLAFVSLRGKSAFAILADIGGSELGEGSIALAKLLGGVGNPRSETLPNHVIYVLFPGSGAGRPLTVDQINGMGRAAFNVWGGFPRLWELFPEEFLGDYVVPPGIAAMA
jgi:Fungal chitosanase of glycosyl hydrolase group 75